MYVTNQTFHEVAAYICGYAAGSPDCPLSRGGLSSFNRYICALYGFPEKYVWTAVISKCTQSDEEAIDLARSRLIDFAKQVGEGSTYDQIVEQAVAKSPEEGEAEASLRSLLAALFTGDREAIEPRILDHPQASVLWKASYPPDVAKLIISVTDSYRIARLPGGTEDSVQLLSADYPFPIEVRRIGNEWKVDASKIIEWHRPE